ncbi:MAG: ABC transporter permease [Bryobacteraceae bacterium]
MNPLRFFRRRRWDAERAAELESYVEMETARQIETGLSPADARAAARRKLGNATLIREAIYEMNTVAFLDSLWRDLRLAVRNLRRNPSFTIVVVITLALGIGANTAIFSVVDGAMFRPLTVPDAHHLVAVDTAASRETRYGNSSYLDWLDFRARSHSFQDLAIFSDLSASLNPAGAVPGVSPQLARGLMVSDNFFSTLGVPAGLGRTFLPEEGKAPGRDPVVVLGYGFWRNALAADPSIVGKQVRLNAHSFTVIGVAPEWFTGVELFQRPDFYVPVMMTTVLSPDGDGLLVNRSWRSFAMDARLRPGVTLEQAQAELTVLMRELERQYPESNRNTVGIVRYEMERRTDGNGSMAPKIVLALVGLVLFIAAANVASLMMARAFSRMRETSTQLAMGASRFRLVRQFLTESAILAALGLSAGVLMAAACIRELAALLPADGTPLFQIDRRALAWAAGSALVAILFGLAPALLSVRDAWAAVASTRTAVSGHFAFSGIARRFLIGGQVALSVMLLIAAGLFSRAFVRAQGIDLGFRPDHVLLVETDPSLQGLPPEKSALFHRQLVERAVAVSGVRSASFAAWVPFVNGDSWDLSIDGYTTPGGDKWVDTTNNRVSPGYFATMGIPLLCGREFRWQDDRKAPLVAIVNEALARRYLIGQASVEKALGHILRLREGVPIQVVGVAADSNVGIIGPPPDPVVYLPAMQMGGPRMTLHVRTAGDPASLAPLIRSQIAALNPEVVPIRVDTLRNVVNERGLAGTRLTAVLTASFGALGLLLSVVGLYGVVSFMVGRRTQEIGVRMALGASRGRVLRMIVANGLALVSVGLVVGLAASMAVTRLMSDLLFGVSPWDIGTFVSIAAILVLSAIAASAIPAIRAMRVDPMTALRYE